jgi:hypothetical protein
MYRGLAGERDAYLYAPVFSQVIEPLRSLGWDGFRTVWRAGEIAALVGMTGPLSGPLLLVNPVLLEVNIGNIHLLMAAAIVAGFRWPALWSFVLLTKITPGVGLLWFAVRREWRSLAIALGATAAIAAASFVADPSVWFDWLRALTFQHDPTDTDLFTNAPLVLRILFAAGLVIWGAKRNQRWTVLVAALIALPVVWTFAVVMLVGLAPLLRTSDSSRGSSAFGPTARRAR